MSKQLMQFVNTQSSPVTVFDENKQSVTVGCFERRHTQANGIFLVKGEHYKQFEHPFGPLRRLSEADGSTFQDSQVRIQGDAETPINRAAIAEAAKAKESEKATEVAEEVEYKDNTEASTPDTSADKEEKVSETAPEQDSIDTEEIDTSADKEEEYTVEDKTEAQVREMTKKDMVAFAKRNGVASNGNLEVLTERVISELYYGPDDEDDDGDSNED